ncbi:MAG: winged helix-turn-helix domain-containing protein [Gemmatales bacterium]
MANKKLKVGGGELKLLAKKDKGEKKPKWQAKTGKKVKVEPMAEVPEVVEPGLLDEGPTLPPEPTEPPDVATTPEAMAVEPTTTGQVATTHDPVPTATELQLVETPATTDEPAPKRPRKLKVQTDLQPKKLSMIKAALQVQQERKVAMTCPELIDVMATEGLWSSPGGKTPAATLYAAISRSIKDLGKASPFRRTERGRFEVNVLPKE